METANYVIESTTLVRDTDSGHAHVFIVRNVQDYCVYAVISSTTFKTHIRTYGIYKYDQEAYDGYDRFIKSLLGSGFTK